MMEAVDTANRLSRFRKSVKGRTINMQIPEKISLKLDLFRLVYIGKVWYKTSVKMTTTNSGSCFIGQHNKIIQIAKTTSVIPKILSSYSSQLCILNSTTSSRSLL